MRIVNSYLRLEEKVCDFAKKHSLTLLRYAFALIYFWFGWLKLLGLSPADELVYRSVEWLEAPHFILFLALWEIIIGISFAVRKLNRLALWMFFLKIPGTFLPLITSPELCFTVFPYGLTLEGQYIFKNLIMVAAAFVIVASLQGSKRRLGENPKNK